MSGSKRCPFRRQDCGDRCALYDAELAGCSLVSIRLELREVSRELFFIGVVMTGGNNKQEATDENE